MKYRKLGKTGLEISEIIFGGGAVGGILINANDDTRRRAVRMALDAGIIWIDTAASYGNGLSEKAISWLIDELPEQDRPYISTKKPSIEILATYRLGRAGAYGEL